MLTWLRRRPFLIAFAIIVIAVAATDYAFVRSLADKRYDNCISKQQLYDGQIVLATFLAEKFGATPTQIKAGITELERTKLPPRPVCHR